MTRIEKLFKTKKENILSIYFTAGYPELNNTISIIRELTKSGIDMIEIGIPFSDPVADGPVIQRSSEIALQNGMSVNLLFEQLKDVRETTDIPLILMGYINPVFRFGIENFLCKCSETGIDGTIIPDLPVETYIDSKYFSADTTDSCRKNQISRCYFKRIFIYGFNHCHYRGNEQF
jgi:tryptophan synthase alpha chain